jgi:hypothetical protein
MKTVKLLWLAVIALALSAYGQMDRVYGPTNINTAQSFLKISGDGYATAGFQITGTWVGTITFESTIDDETWVSVSATNRASGATGSTTTANGVFNIPSTGVRSVRARMSAYTSGTAVITPILSPASLSSSGGGGEVTNAGTFAVQAGQVADGAAASGNPVFVGAVVQSTDATAEAAGDVKSLQATLTGKLVTMPYSLVGERWSYAAASGGIVNTTGVTIKAAVSGQKNCVTSIDIINGHASVSTEVVLRDGASGTVLKRWWMQAAGGGISKTLPVPICGTTNTLLEVAAITTGSAIYVNAEGYEGAE